MPCGLVALNHETQIKYIKMIPYIELINFNQKIQKLTNYKYCVISPLIRNYILVNIILYIIKEVK